MELVLHLGAELGLGLVAKFLLHLGAFVVDLVANLPEVSELGV